MFPEPLHPEVVRFPIVLMILQPIVLEQAKVHKARHEETDVIALGCGDLDSDGGLEIVVASRARIAFFMSSSKSRAGFARDFEAVLPCSIFAIIACLAFSENRACTSGAVPTILNTIR